MTDSAIPPITAAAPRAGVDESLVGYTHVIYALHALSVLIGLTSFRSIATSFIWSLPAIIAVIMNYARRQATQGSYLESHFKWQIRTFWYAALWVVVMAAVKWPLIASVIGIPLYAAGRLGLAAWIIYRVARGWVGLADKRAMYA